MIAVCPVCLCPHPIHRSNCGLCLLTEEQRDRLVRSIALTERERCAKLAEHHDLNGFAFILRHPHDEQDKECPPNPPRSTS